MTETQNPFLKKYQTLHETPPFSKIHTGDYEPAFEIGMTQHLTEINLITSNSDAPTFENTIVAYERSGELLTKLNAIFYNLLSAESDDEMMDISQRLSPKTSEHYNNITLNDALFNRIKTVYNKRNNLELNVEQIRLVEKIYEGFEECGATLSDEDKIKYREYSSALNQLTLDFGQNALKASNAYEMHLTAEADLLGIPENVREVAKIKATEKGTNGWIFDLSAPSYIAFMKYASRRDLRKQLYMAFATKCVGGKFDNQQNILKIAEIRLKIANLFNCKDYTSFSLRNKMAKNKDAVFRFLDELFESFATAAHLDVKEVQDFANKMEANTLKLEPWDWSYYSEKLKDEKYSVSDELVRPYFELENVKNGIFGLATTLYGLTFNKNTEICVYNEEVEAFEVFDGDGKFLAVLFTDFHPRQGKRQGAWMTEFKGQYIKNGIDSRPHISIVMNFTRPTPTTPALLTFDEVETFLHEFGHALHGMLAKSTYESLSGTNVERDFVELPSQIMENWLTEKEYLDKFAIHYKTGEVIPSNLVQKLIDASNFNAGYFCYRQLSFAYLDMAWHSLSEPYWGDVKIFEKIIMSKTALLPIHPDTAMSPSFGHIFSGGYAAGYYSYKWAEVLDADAFAYFQQNGIFDKETATSFRENILERGNTEDPMTLYIKFRGQMPTIEALLRRSGISK